MTASRGGHAAAAARASRAVQPSSMGLPLNRRSAGVAKLIQPLSSIPRELDRRRRRRCTHSPPAGSIRRRRPARPSASPASSGRRRRLGDISAALTASAPRRCAERQRLAGRPRAAPAVLPPRRRCSARTVASARIRSAMLRTTAATAPWALRDCAPRAQHRRRARHRRTRSRAPRPKRRVASSSSGSARSRTRRRAVLRAVTRLFRRSSVSRRDGAPFASKLMRTASGRNLRTVFACQTRRGGSRNAIAVAGVSTARERRRGSPWSRSCRRRTPLTRPRRC